MNDIAYELIRITCPADLIAREQYVEVIDEKIVTPILALSAYSFGEDYRCGLKGCRTIHRNGYLVKNNDGSEANIGGDCGRNYFGDNFTRLTNALKDRTRRAENINALRGFLDQWPALNQEILSLRAGPHGTTWAKNAVKDKITEEFKKHSVQLITELRTRARRNDVHVTKSIRLSAKERDDFKAKFPGVQVPQFNESLIGTLSGLECFVTFPDSKLDDIVSLRRDMIQQDLNSSPNAVLTKLSKRLGDVDRMIEEAKFGIQVTEEFLSDRNWELVRYISQNMRGLG